MTKGIRNNNPGNLRPGRYPWVGQTFVDSQGYCVFESWQKGVRALVLNLMAYRNVHKLDTIRGIIKRWAPSNENDTDKYIAFVAKHMGEPADAKLDLKSCAVVQKLVEAIIYFENGSQPYDTNEISLIVSRNVIP